MEFDEHILIKESCFIDVYHGIGKGNRGRTYRGVFKHNMRVLFCINANCNWLILTCIYI